MTEPTVHNFGKQLMLYDDSVIMRGSRKYCQRGSNSNNFFLVDEGREDPNSAKSGPSSARQRNGIEMAFRWWADDG